MDDSVDYSLPLLLNQVFPRFFSDVNKVQGSEHNFLCILYHRLILAGLDISQVCREMYSKNTQKRPDIAIFDREINGRYSILYHGNCEMDNDDIKRKYLRCIIEMKGGCNKETQALSNFRSLKEDVDKLQEWGDQFGDDKDYIFLAINLKGFGRPLTDEKTKKIIDHCQKNKVHFIYYLQHNRYYKYQDYRLSYVQKIDLNPNEVSTRT